MFQWLADNAEGVKTFLALLGFVVTTVIVPLLVKSGRVHKDTARIMAQGVEDVNGMAIRTLESLQKANRDGKVDFNEVAEAISKGVKGEIRERAVKTGVQAVIGALSDRAAEADPKDEKTVRSPLSRFLGVIRPKVLGG